MEEGTHKQPFAIRQPDHALFAFAGLWETWHDIDIFTIVTTERTRISEWVNNARHDDPRCLEPR